MISGLNIPFRNIPIVGDHAHLNHILGILRSEEGIDTDHIFKFQCGRAERQSRLDNRVLIIRIGLTAITADTVFIAMTDGRNGFGITVTTAGTSVGFDTVCSTGGCFGNRLNITMTGRYIGIIAVGRSGAAAACYLIDRFTAMSGKTFSTGLIPALGTVGNALIQSVGHLTAGQLCHRHFGGIADRSKRGIADNAAIITVLSVCTAHRSRIDLQVGTIN